MSPYIRVPLGEVCLINPRVAKNSLPDEATPVSFVPMAAVDEVAGRIQSPEVRALAEVSKGFTAFQNEDVIFAKITPCMENGKAALARGLQNGMGRGSTEFHVLRAGDRILPELVYHYVRWPKFRADAKRHFTGTAGQQRVPKSFLENALIPLPPIEEQRRIVDILNRAASIERLRAQAQAKLREFIPALFIKMFGDPITNPMGWEVKPLGEVVDGFRGGKNVQAGSGSSPYRILKISAITTGTFVPDESKPAPDDHEPSLEHIVREGDVLFSRANTSELVGATALVDVAPENLLLPDKLWRIVWLDPSPILPLFLLRLFQQSSVRSAMSALATGTSASMQNISQAKLKQLKVIVPPLAAQDKFVALLESAAGVSASSRIASAATAALIASLMSKLFGEAA